MYSARITRNTPALFVLLVDQSGSMDERTELGHNSVSKAEYVARVVNGFISELVGRCRREEGLRDYFSVAAIGYSDDEVRPLLCRDFDTLSPTRLALLDRPRTFSLEERRLSDGRTALGRVEQTLWLEPFAGGNTPMLGALETAHDIIARWCGRTANRVCYPPVVINVSDGEATDGNPLQLDRAAEKIKSITTDDGNAILINIHITCDADAPRALFPCSCGELPADRNARLLYEMSSQLPNPYNDRIARLKGGSFQPPFRAMSYNTPVAELVTMMNIGSMSVQLFQ